MKITHRILSYVNSRNIQRKRIIQRIARESSSHLPNLGREESNCLY